MSTTPNSTGTPAARLTHVLRAPLDRFFQLEAASGVLLLGTTLVAIAWANSPWAASYDALWNTPLTLGLDGHMVTVSIERIINDGLMAVFFFAAGLEIRRELTTGELADVRRAALPVIAAAGGMLAPAAIYLALNPGTTSSGWGVPMATDIAFAVGVLTVLGRRVPPSMRVFLLALAIIDDIGTILIIAFFYSTGVRLEGLGIALLGLLAIIGLQRLGAVRTFTYAVPSIAVWVGLAHAGVHPTVAGVLVGLMVPARPWPQPSADASPAETLERGVHPWVSFVIMPLFALANAGVVLRVGGLFAAPTLALGIGAGLLIGKPVGIIAASAVAVRLRIASLPEALTWRGIIVVGLVAGIGFTMALFMTDLALSPEHRDAAKLTVIVTSAVAAIAALVVGRLVLSREPAAEPAPTARRRFIADLERGPLAFVLLVFGVICAALELTADDRIAGRAVLFVVVAIVGLTGMLRRRHA